MATAFRIHEDIENVLDGNQKKDHQKHGKPSSMITGKCIATENKLEKQALRPTFAILNNVTNDGGRNVGAVATSHAQKTVRNSIFNC